MNTDFSDILERSRALRSLQVPSNAAVNDNIPRLERALPQIDSESRRLVSHVDQRSKPSGDPHALRLLSEYGYEVDRIERTLQSVALLDAFEPLHTAPDTDLQSFLEAESELTITATIDSSLRRAKAHSISTLSASIDAEWDAAKRDLVTLPNRQPYTSHPRLSQQTTASALPAFASPFRQPRASRVSTAFDPTATPASSLSIYHAVIRRMVYERGPRSPPIAIATELDDALLANMAPRGDYSVAPKGVQHLHAVFTALRYITGEYLPTLPSIAAFQKCSPGDLARRTCIGAHRYLCLQFREDKMRREIEGRPVEARRGGIPGVKADVRAFLNLVFDRGVPEQLAKGPMYDGMPVWAFVYYCLRAGFVEEAVQVVDDTITNGFMEESLQLYSECLHAFLDSGDRRILPRHLLEKLMQHYGLVAKRGDDPYQRVCYIVIARVDPAGGDKVSLLDSDYGLLFYSIEDYLWLRLSVARMEGDSALPDSLSTYGVSLRDIGDEIRKFGPAHFNTEGDSATFYALVLILTGQFSEAIGYLEEKARALTEATHIAFVLYYYGMIRDGGVSRRHGSDADDVGKELLVDYARVVWRYASQLSRSDAGIAALYVFTIRDIMVRKELVKRLLLEGKGYEVLLGRNGDGGVLAELWNKEELGGDLGLDGWKTVVVEAAEEAERKGERDCALQLYEIGGVMHKMAEIHMNRVSVEVSCRGSQKRERVLKEGREYVRRCGVNGERLAVSEKVMGSLRVLLEMGEFLDLRWNGKLEEALVVLERMRILPKDEGDVMTKVSELGLGSVVWCEGVIERVPELIVVGMEVLAGVYGKRGDGGENEEGKRLRGWARSIVNLSGMMRNLSADMSARLVGLEVLIN